MTAAFREDPRHVLQAVSWLELPWLEHGFGSRLSHEWNEPTGVRLKQIHSDICVNVTVGQGTVGEGDALLTDTPGLRITVRTADCVPIILVDTSRKAVAVIHAGWRGTARQISSKAVAAMRLHFGTEPGTILAAIGPAIGPCCYQVGGEVAAEFRGLFPERDDLTGKTYLDLPEANRRQMLGAGVQDRLISLAGECTYCSPGRFHSWRRDRTDAGRMIAAARIIEI